MSERRYQLRGPGVVYETVDGETIVVNLDSGTYYDLNRTGACIFELIAACASFEETIAGICGAYDVDPATATADTDRLIDELLDEGLLTPARSGSDQAQLSVRPEPRGTSEYTAPLLGKYTDMQELLLLDPVHEVDETGWPSTA